ncbi:MAG TPA: hypothetical protein VLX31_08065 [Streptosporangiaceae bacterium]|nr:hypothetical protein [Streptosporangiaceae bacterium]
MRKHLLLAAAVMAGLVTILPLTAATAAGTAGHSVLTDGSPKGPNVKRGAILKAGLKGSATFFSPGTKAGVTCKSSAYTDRVTKNPPAGKVATELLTAQSFGKCSVSGVPGAKSVKDVTVVGLPYKTTVSGAGTKPIVISKARTKITLGTILGSLVCTYGATQVKGTSSNVGQVSTFTNQTFTKVSGSAACPSKGNFSATFGPLTDTSVKSHPHVFVN